MDQILTEQDLNKSWNNISPSLWCLIASRARALLAQRDRLVKERDDAVVKVHHAVTAETKANEELTECRHALGGFMGPTYGISEEVKKVVAERDTLAARVKEIEERMAPYPSHLPERPALGLFAGGVPGAVSSTAVDPAKPGLQPMKCPCGGKIEFGRERVGYCQKCGASCRVMDPPAPTQPPEGHMVHIPAEYCGKSSLMHAYADGYLAGKGAK